MTDKLTREENNALKEASSRIQQALENGSNELDLSGLAIPYIPEEITFLADSLTELGLNNCTRIKDFSGIEEFKILKTLYAAGCDLLKDLKGLESCIALENLDLDGCLSLTDISALKTLTNLTHLDLRLCGNISDKQWQFIKHLTDLRNFIAAETSLKNIDFLSGLHKLEMVLVLGNWIEDLSAFHSTPQLNILDLSLNNITDIQQLKKLVELENLTELHIADNPFVEQYDLEIHLHENCLDIIKDLLNRTFPKDEQNIATITLPAKVLMLGNHGAGKSTLTGYLNHRGLSHKQGSTHILNIEHYPQAPANTENTKNPETAEQDKKAKTAAQLQLPEALLYDFGGQDYYHGIYRVFMSQGAITCLLWHPGSDENREEKQDGNQLPCRHFNREYWLGYWEFVHKPKSNSKPESETNSGSDKSSLLMVQTHADESKNAQLFNHPNILNHHLLDLQDKDKEPIGMQKAGLDYFQSQLTSLITEHQKNLQGVDWYKAFLEHVFEQHNSEITGWCIPTHISELAQYYQAEQTESDENTSTDRKSSTAENSTDMVNALKAQLVQLHRKGVVLYYPDVNDQVVWLNPMAFAHYVHHYLLNKELLTKSRARQGIVPEDAFAKKDEDILKVLQQEKVIFLHKHNPEGPEYIIPNYLPLVDDSQHDYHLMTFALHKSFAFSLWFKKYLPLGLINQLICFFGNLPDRKQFWRNQLIFSLGANENTDETDAKTGADKKDKASHISLVQITLEFSPQLQIKVYVANENAKARQEHIAYIYYVIMCLFADKPTICRLTDFKQECVKFKRLVAESLSTDEGALETVDKRWSKFEKVYYLRYPFDYAYIYLPDDLYISLDDTHFINAQTLANIGEQARIPCEAIPPKKHDSKKTDLSSDTDFSFKTDVSFKTDFYLKNELSVTPFAPFTHNKLHKMQKVFISYSHADIAERRELQQYLINLERDGVIELWQDGMINTGDDWHNSIVSALEEADVVIMLVSQSYIASSYVHSLEMPLALNNMQQAKAKIFPILLRHCDYQNWKVFPKGSWEKPKPDDNETVEKADAVEMAKYQFFPKNDEGKLEALNEWRYPEKAWTQVADELRALSKS